MLLSPIRTPEINPALTTHPAASRPANEHWSFLDGVRAIAALWVVASHLWIVPFGMNARGGWLGRLTNWTLYSHFAVDIFIVLSGFCLILPVARAGALCGGAGQFFRRRARRILPPFYAALGFSILVSLAIEALEHQSLHIGRQALLANLFLVQDLFLGLNIFNGPFWSIAVEWRIYWVFPLLVWLLRRQGRRGVLLAAALAGGAATLALARWRPEMFLACPWYLLLFAAGLCAGSLSVERPRRGEKAQCEGAMLICLAAAAALVCLHPVTPQGNADFGLWMPVMDAAVGAGTAAGLLWVSRSPRRFPLLSKKPLASLGTWAYSIYLTHMPCLLLLNALLTVWGPRRLDPLHHVLILLLLLPLTLGMARLFFLIAERPFMSRPQERRPGSEKLNTQRTESAASGIPVS